MQNYSIVTVGSPVFFQCLKEQKIEYNLQNLSSFKQVKEILKSPLIDIYIFLFFVDNIERLNVKELKKIRYPKIFFSKSNDQLKLLKKNNVMSNFFQLPINYPDMEKIIKLSIMKYKFLFQSQIKIGSYVIDKNAKLLIKSNKNIKLTEKEIEILLYLSGKEDGSSKKEVSQGVNIDSHTYETHLYRLRQKIHKKFNDKHLIYLENSKYYLKNE